MRNRNKYSLRVKQAAEYLGVYPDTLRRWSREGKLPFEMVGRERKYSTEDLDAFLKRPVPISQRVWATYARVSGHDQQISLDNQIKLLKQQTNGEVYKNYTDVGSGLSTTRPGLTRMLKAAKAGKFNTLIITHKDRLTRFGYEYLEQLFETYGVEIIVLQDKTTKSTSEELVEDFMSLLASFSGKLYGIRSAEHKKKLLTTLSTNLQEDLCG